MVPISGVELPEQRPESFLFRMKPWKAGHHTAVERPRLTFPDQIRPNRIREDVEADLGEGVSFSLFLAEHMVVGLVLPFPAIAQNRFQFRPQEPHGVELVAVTSHSHPDKVQMIRHQTVGWTPDLVADGGVEQHFTKCRLKRGGEPPSGTFLQRQGPEDNRVSLIVVPIQARQIPLGLEGHVFL